MDAAPAANTAPSTESNEPIKEATSNAPSSEPSSSWMNGNGDFGDGVPENIKNLLDSKKWTNVEQLVKGYSELEKFKGVASGDHLVFPENAEDVEGWNKIYSKLGKPETADKYEFKNETGVEIGDELMSAFKEFAHKENYTQKQLAGAVQFQLEAVKASEEISAQQSQERKDSNIEAMKDRWKDKYDTTQTKINAIAEKLQVKSFLEEMGIDKEPEIVNMLLTIANSDSEDNLNPDGAPAPAAKGLQEQLKDIMSTKAFADKFHVDHKKIMSDYMNLTRQIANAGLGRAPSN